MEEPRFLHTPVLAQAVADLLIWNSDGIYIDGTVGGGGHAAALMARVAPKGRIIGIDQDMDAIAAARRRFAGDKQMTIRHGNFADIPAILDQEGILNIHGVLLDLGVSSYQIDSPARGFSFMNDGPLDMRMDRTLTTTAADLINHAPYEKLIRIILNYGEERLARPIVKAIIEARQRTPVKTTGQLAAIVRGFAGRGPVNKTCARVFQALRIAVNEELDRLESGLSSLIFRLVPGGRIVVIAYHSLEDRIVKHTFQALARHCVCPPEWPVCRCNQTAVVSLLTKRPICPSDEEIGLNPRARSAKLRGAERLPGILPNMIALS